ncbi:unnamed protein product, partial [marine sediment metagenome]
GKDWDVTWTEGGRRMRLFQVGEENTTHVLAQSPSGNNRPRMSAISRRHGKETIFVSVIEPYQGRSKLRGLTCQTSEDNKTITVELRYGKGKDTVVIPIQPGKGLLKSGSKSGEGYAMWNGKLIKNKKP